MQQRLAVASVLVLVLLTGASAVLIQSHIYAQSAPKSSTQTVSSHESSATLSTNASTNSTSNNSSLLTGGSHAQSGSDDGNAMEYEIETEYHSNSTLGANSTNDR